MCQNCPLCERQGRSVPEIESVQFRCNDCTVVNIDEEFFLRGTRANWHLLYAQAKEHYTKYRNPALVRYVRDGEAQIVCQDRKQQEVPPPIPALSIRDKAWRLLRELVKRSEHFGATVKASQSDWLLAYCKDKREVSGLCAYLEGLGYVKKSPGGAWTDLTVTGEGISAIESSELRPPTTVFISSTCYDLIDVRMELASHLEQLGCIVYLSDDPERFDPSSEQNSIESCKLNLENSDLVLVFIDRRYGPKLKDYGDLSATHVEVNHAKALRKPTYYFIRDRAFEEHSRLKNNSSFESKWVESHNVSARASFVSFVNEIIALPGPEDDRSNWIDQFRSIVDLKRIVTKRVQSFRLR